MGEFPSEEKQNALARYGRRRAVVLPPGAPHAGERYDIDEMQIKRTSADGTSVWSWRDVREVRPYPTGYLLRLVDESMSIPYRYLNADQRARFRAMIQR